MSFYEPDEPDGEVVRAFQDGEKRRTAAPVGWRCEHLSVTSAHLAGSLSGGCGCDMQPVYAGGYLPDFMPGFMPR